MKILVADDEPDIRDTMRILLELRGHSVEVAENGQVAVNTAVKSPPDLILMDIRMPVLDGLAATRLLRARPETAAVPIICVSGYLGDGRSLDDAWKAGCFECLPKPLEWTKFEQLLKRLQPNSERPH